MASDLVCDCELRVQRFEREYREKRLIGELAGLMVKQRCNQYGVQQIAISEYESKVNENYRESIRMPRTSVVMPLYNRAHYLEVAIDSILNQTYQDFEIVIVDDGSTENVKDAVDKCIAKAPDKIRYMNQVNAGAGAARNTGINESKGEIIAFLDADDEWRPDYLTKTVECIDNGYDWSCTASYRVVLNQDEQEIEHAEIQMEEIPNAKDLYAALLKEVNWIGGPSQVVVKKDCLEKVGNFREDLPVREDWELWIRFAKANFKVKKILEPLYLYKMRQNSITKTDRTIGMDSTYRVFTQYSKEAFALDESNRKLYADKLWNLSRHLFYDSLKNFPLIIKCCFISQVYCPSIKRFRKSLSGIRSNKEMQEA